MKINAGYGADVTNITVSSDTPEKLFDLFSIGMFDQFRTSYNNTNLKDVISEDEYHQMFCLYDYRNEDGQRGLLPLLCDIINYKEFNGRKIFKLGKYKNKSFIYVPSYTPEDSEASKKMLTIHKISKIIHSYEYKTGISNISCDDIIINTEEITNES